jgi:hypothetical protein
MKRPEANEPPRVHQSYDKNRIPPYWIQCIVKEFEHLHPQWILPIPEGGKEPAQKISLYLQGTQLIQTMKLENGIVIPTEWNNPCQFPIFSHTTGQQVNVALNLPPQGEPVLMVDDAFDSGQAAHDFIHAVQPLITIVGFAVKKQYYQGSLEAFGRNHNIPVFALECY